MFLGENQTYSKQLTKTSICEVSLPFLILSKVKKVFKKQILLCLKHNVIDFTIVSEQTTF